MPSPGAAGLRIFHDHFRMVVINLSVENLLGGIDDGFAAREHAVDGVTGVVPKGKADNLAAAVVPPEGVVVKGFILLRGTSKQVDFLRIEHAADECIPFLPVFSESIWSDGPLAIREVSCFGVSHRVQSRTRTSEKNLTRGSERFHVQRSKIRCCQKQHGASSDCPRC